MEDHAYRFALQDRPRASGTADLHNIPNGFAQRRFVPHPINNRQAHRKNEAHNRNDDHEFKQREGTEKKECRVSSVEGRRTLFWSGGELTSTLDTRLANAFPHSTFDTRHSNAHHRAILAVMANIAESTAKRRNP